MALTRAGKLTKAYKTFMLLGQCVPSVKQNASKIRVKRLALDEKLLMVSSNKSYVYKRICISNQKFYDSDESLLLHFVWTLSIVSEHTNF
jgi:hypothetical protein